jgi:predicted CXXCH cytochrome family protein
MFTASKGKKLLGPQTLSWMLGVVIAGTAQFAGADIATTATAPDNTKTCLFSQQLQASASARNKYVSKLVAVIGGSVQEASPVEQMYGNIKKASYSESEYDTEQPERDIWGFEVKQTVRPIGLDPFSADCLSCHDGVGASPVAAVLKNNPFSKRHDALPGSSDHPIGMDYNAYAGANRGYKSLFGVNNKMVFVDGKVGCLTCHDPLNAEQGHLVMSDQHSALCLTCHNK